MKWLLPALLIGAAGVVSSVQERHDERLPGGKSQTEEILKADYQKSLRDAADIVRLGDELQAELKKSGYDVLPIPALKKTEEIERLAKRIRSRLRRF